MNVSAVFKTHTPLRYQLIKLDKKGVTYTGETTCNPVPSVHGW